MRKRNNLLLLLLMASVLLSGCAMQTVNKLYCPPKRTEEYNDLQRAMDAVMGDMEFCAPLSGENQQTVQMADLDGDGTSEFLVFAKGTGERPLKILIFDHDTEDFVLMDTIESSGHSFDQVEYIQMDQRPGLELVVGRQVSDRVLRSLSVYSFADGVQQRLMSANYSKYLTCDLDNDSCREVLILRPGQVETDNGIAELYSYTQDGIERSAEVGLSEPVGQIKRIMVSSLDGGIPAVYVASAVDDSAIITDVFADVNGKLTNISFSNESGTSVKTLRNYYVYASDIDEDGVIELPGLISMMAVNLTQFQQRQYLIRWYALTVDAEEVDKQYTYHNYAGGWYLRLADEWAPRAVVEHQITEENEERFDFYVWNETYDKADKLMTVFALTGPDREEAAMLNNRFVLYKTDTTIFAANLEGASTSYGLTQERVIESFSLIRLDWKTGET